MVSPRLALLALLALNRSGIARLAPHFFVLILWASVLKCGVHATLAGVALALFIPLRAQGSGTHSPLRRLEHDLHAPVAFAILPLFAFANAGVSPWSEATSIGINPFAELDNEHSCSPYLPFPFPRLKFADFET